MLKNIKAFFFDLDDTLINFSGATKQVWEISCEKMLNKYPEISINCQALIETIIKHNDAFWTDENKRPKGNIQFKIIRKMIFLIQISTAPYVILFNSTS